MSRLPYDVTVAGESTPIDLQRQERIELRYALSRAPSGSFLKAYSFALSAYVTNLEEIEELGPKQVANRLKAVLDRGHEMQKALDNLRVTDRNYVGLFWTRKFLANKNAASESEFIRLF